MQPSSTVGVIEFVPLSVFVDNMASSTSSSSSSSSSTSRRLFQVDQTSSGSRILRPKRTSSARSLSSSATSFVWHAIASSPWSLHSPTFLSRYITLAMAAFLHETWFALSRNIGNASSLRRNDDAIPFPKLRLFTSPRLSVCRSEIEWFHLHQCSCPTTRD